MLKYDLEKATKKIMEETGESPFSANISAKQLSLLHCELHPL